MVNDVVMPTVNGIVMPMINSAATVATTTVEKVAGTRADDDGVDPAGRGRHRPPPAPPVAAAPAPPAATPPPPKPLMTYQDWHIGPILIGQFLAALLNFVILAASVFFMIVKVVGWMSKRFRSRPRPPRRR